MRQYIKSLLGVERDLVRHQSESFQTGKRAGVQLFTRFPQGLIPTSTGHALAAIEKDFINLMTHYAKKEWDNGMSYKQD